MVSKVLDQYGVLATTELRDHVWTSLVQPARKKGLTLAMYIAEAFQGNEVEAFRLPSSGDPRLPAPPAPPAPSSAPASAPAPAVVPTSPREVHQVKRKKKAKDAPPSSTPLPAGTQKEKKKGFDAVFDAAISVLGKPNTLHVRLDVNRFQDPPASFKVKAFDPSRTEGIAKAILPSTMSPAKLVIVDETEEQQAELTKLVADPAKFERYFNTSSISEISALIGAPCIIGGYHSSKALILTAADPKVNKEMDPDWCLRSTRVYRFSEIEVDPDIPASDAIKYRNRVVMAMAELDNSSNQASNAFKVPGPGP